MKKNLYPSESLFYRDISLTPEDRLYLSARGSFFNTLAKDVQEVLRTLDFIDLKLKKMEDKVNGKKEKGHDI